MLKAFDDFPGGIPANIETRFVRLCNTFDDLLSLLAFSAFGMIPPSDRFQEHDCVVLRNHLSLCGVVVADLHSTHSTPEAFPSTKHRAKKRGNIVWGQMESRSYIFGAVRNEHDAFTDAFLNEIRSRPDLFQLVTRSDTDPGRIVESFGSSESGEALPSLRTRLFEAPDVYPPTMNQANEQWEVQRSAVDILYGRRNFEVEGYLTALEGPNGGGWFFRFKNMPVKFFVILDSTPGRKVHILMRNVAWAAFKARGLVKAANYEKMQYVRASDSLYQACTKERLGYGLASDVGWTATKLEDVIGTTAEPKCFTDSESDATNGCKVM